MNTPRVWLAAVLGRDLYRRRLIAAGVRYFLRRDAMGGWTTLRGIIGPMEAAPKDAPRFGDTRTLRALLLRGDVRIGDVVARGVNLGPRLRADRPPWHAGVIVRETEIVEMTLRGVVLTDVDVFAAGRCVFCVRRPADPIWTVARAVSRIGDRGYNVLDNNCVTFANSCLIRS